jgi:hypothetical protein
MLAFSDSVTVALAVLTFVAVILITSILRYKADDFVKFWAAVGTVMGLALGGVGTFFFTRDQVIEKDRQLQVAQTALNKSEHYEMALQRLAEGSQSRSTEVLPLSEEEIWRAFSNYIQEKARQRQSPPPSPSPTSSPRSIERDKRASPAPSVSASPTRGD